MLKVPEGVIDFAANIPSRDLTLVAPTTQLVARPDLHPALINLLLEAATVVHKFGGEFKREGEFPTPKYEDNPDLFKEMNCYTVVPAGSPQKLCLMPSG